MTESPGLLYWKRKDTCVACGEGHGRLCQGAGQAVNKGLLWVLVTSYSAIAPWI